MIPDRLPIVGVMGSGAEPHDEPSHAIGTLLAELGVHLLTGGGGGVMEAVSRSFHGTRGRKGLVIGVLPAADEPGRSRPGYPNPWVEVPIRTHLPLSGKRGMDARSRNHINVLSSDAIVALPGGEGTASEVRLAVRYGRPVIAYLPGGADIPGLPPEVRLAESTEEVRAYLSHVLETRSEGDGE